MARKLRNWPPGIKLHITSRGIRQQSLFYEEEDYLKYLSFLKETHKKYPFFLHNYCLMTNHTHLQLETIEAHPGRIMMNLNTNYAKYFNKKYDFKGHVFEKRYWAEMIDSPSYELDVSRYIHLNPVKAGICTAPEDYRWSSCRAYTAGEEFPLLYTKQIQSYFPNPFFPTYEAYLKAPDINPAQPKKGDASICGQK